MSRRSRLEAQLRELEDAVAGSGEQFVIESPTFRIPEGHERLTREAATGLPSIGPADVRAMVVGVRRVDTGIPTKHFTPGQQPRHALRQSLCQPLGPALSLIRNHLMGLYGSIMAAGSNRQAAFEWIGEALHLIQDSYSPAHTERQWGGPGGRHPLLYIRYFGPWGQPPPLEHGVIPPHPTQSLVSDPRDLITDSGGALTLWAREALTASREFLALILRHLAGPGAPGNAAELRAFMDKHFDLSPRRTEPRQFYLRCRL